MKQNKNIYPLIQVTKPKYFHKPTYGTLQDSLTAMKQHCEEHGVKKLAMPRIGCGLDKLEWTKVREMVKETFEKTNVEVTVYALQSDVYFQSTDQPTIVDDNQKHAV